MNTQTHTVHNGDNHTSTHEQQKSLMYKLGAGLLSALILATLIYTWRELRYIVGQPVGTSYFTVVGKGEVNTPPDIAEVIFTIRETNDKVATAQEAVKAKTKSAAEALTALEIKDADIITENYSSYPKYDYNGWCEKYPCNNQKLVGYEVTQTVRVKVRNVDNVGTVLEKLGALGITELQGPNFTIDDMEKVRSDARGEAIKDAQEKASILADQLDVRIVRMTNFDDGGNRDGYPTPMMYKAEAQAMGADAAQDASNGIFVGDKKVTSQVSITYEVK